jgi:F0F1-type ATP synthase assembly protein I
MIMKNNYSGKIINLLINTTAWIVGPVLLGVLVGKMLDQKFKTDPWLFLVSIGVCFLISMFGLIRNALKEFRRIEEECEKEEKK